MAVVTITPQDGVRYFPAGTVPGIMHVYCLGPGSADYVIQIDGQEPTVQHLDPGHTETFAINGQDFYIRDYGTSSLQLLWTMPIGLDVVSKEADEGVGARFDALHECSEQ